MLRENAIDFVFALCVEDLCEAVLLMMQGPTWPEKSKVLGTNSQLDPPKSQIPNRRNLAQQGRKQTKKQTNTTKQKLTEPFQFEEPPTLDSGVDVSSIGGTQGARIRLGKFCPQLLGLRLNPLQDNVVLPSSATNASMPTTLLLNF